MMRHTSIAQHPLAALRQPASVLALILALTVVLLAGCAGGNDPSVDDEGGDDGGVDDVGLDARFETGLDAIGAPFCGDGNVDDGLGEECDDGNTNADDLCNNDCERNPGDLCDPCELDAHCAGDALCVDYLELGGEDVEMGLFCGRSCADAECPEGYECVAITDDGGDPIDDQCVPLSGYCGECPDADDDEVCDRLDACPGGDDAADTDGDGVPNACDRCEGGDDRFDGDADTVPDECDICPGGDDALDADGDFVPDTCDLCAGSDDRDDADEDTVPDGCDACAAGDDLTDSDSDGVADACDVCLAGDDNADADSDGVADACDVCMGGNDTIDGDGDTVPNFCDRCPGADDRLDADADGNPDFCDICAGGDDDADADSDDTPDFCDCDTAGAECSENASCLEQVTGVVCTCLEGWDGDGLSCTDVNECDTPEEAGCDVNAECVNEPGTYDCVCNEGWDGDGFTCGDVDECDLETDTCSDNAECTNVDGSFECDCLEGYDGDGFSCTDIDECTDEIDDCADDATCMNVAGSFICDCAPGQAGNGRACFDPQAVLVYHDSDASWADLAAEALALPVTFAGNANEFYDAFDDGGARVIVIDAAAGTLPSPLQLRLLDWLSMGGKVVFGYWNLDAEADLRAMLGIGSVTEFTTWRDVYPDPASPLDLFDYMESVPTPLFGTDRWFDNGDELTLGGEGFLLARFDSSSGPGAIAVTRDGRSVVNGFLPGEAAANDADGDNVPDIQELYMNQIALVSEGGGCEIVEGFEEGVWPNGFWVVGKEEASYPGTVAQGSARHGLAGIENVGWFYAPDVEVGEPGDRIIAWVRPTSGGRAYIGFGATAAGARSIIVAPNTSELGFQTNDDYDYVDETNVSYTYEAEVWLRAEVEYLTDSRMRASIFDTSGTLLRTTTHEYGTAQEGGIAIRAFNEVDIDSLAICRP